MHLSNITQPSDNSLRDDEVGPAGNSSSRQYVTDWDTITWHALHKLAKHATDGGGKFDAKPTGK